MKNEEYIIAQDREIEQTTGKFSRVVKRAIELYGFWGSVSRYILMHDEFRKFVKNGKTIEERNLRKEKNWGHYLLVSYEKGIQVRLTRKLLLF